MKEAESSTALGDQATAVTAPESKYGLIDNRIKEPNPRYLSRASKRTILWLAVSCVLAVTAAEWMASKASLATIGLYIKKNLKYPTNITAQLAMLMKCLACVASVIGAIVADGYLGKFKVIISGTGVTFISLIGMSVVNLLPATRPDVGPELPPVGLDITRGLAWMFFITMYSATGMVYPCLQGYGADQFDEHNPEEVRLRSSYFYIKQMLSSVISLFSSLVLVGITEWYGYGVAFLISAALYAAALSFFMTGAWLRVFRNVLPLGDSPFSRFYGVLIAAWRKRKLPVPADQALHAQLLDQFDDPVGCAVVKRCFGGSCSAGISGNSHSYESGGVSTCVESVDGSNGCCLAGLFGSKQCSTDAGHNLGHSQINSKDAQAAYELGADKIKTALDPFVDPAEELLKQTTAKIRCIDHAAIDSKPRVPLADVVDTKAFVSLIPIFLCICIYEIGNDMAVMLPLTGDTMQRKTGSVTVPAATVGVFTAVFGILTAFTYDRAIVPFFYRRGIEVSKLWTIGAGIAVELLALLAAALVEKARHNAIAAAGLQEQYQAAHARDPNVRWEEPQFRVPLSIWWQAIPYSLLGISDTLVTTGFIDLAYSQVSAANKSLAIALAVVANAGGGFLATALNSIISQATKGDLWLANNTLYGHYDWFYLVNMAITAVALLLYLAATARFQPRLIAVREEQGGKQQHQGAGNSTSNGSRQGNMQQLISTDLAEGLMTKPWTEPTEGDAHSHQQSMISTQHANDLSRQEPPAAAAAAYGIGLRQEQQPEQWQRPFSDPGLQHAPALLDSLSMTHRPASISAAVSAAVHQLHLRQHTISAAYVPASHGSFVARVHDNLQAELQNRHRRSFTAGV